jgi:hypothetical protein
MQNTVYRVRGYPQILGRLALDMFRDISTAARTATLDVLHLSRAEP